MISNLVKRFKSCSPLNCLITVLSIVFFLGAIISIIILFNTGFGELVFYKKLCFTNTCVKYGFSLYSEALLVLNETLKLLVTFATVGGIVVALLSYFNNAGATALSNHISHFSIFQSYLSNEISKRDRISASSVDTFLWYNAIFFQSRSGLTAISPEYLSLIKAINHEIQKSNLQSETGEGGSFRYRPHQERIIQSLKGIGVVLTHQPRNEFYEIEDQVFSLILAVNKSFCYSDQVPAIINRKYI